MDIYQESVVLHKELAGKLEIRPKKEILTRHDLALLYTPGVAEPCRQIHAHPELIYDLTIKNNTVAVITDGSAVLGLGNIGAEAALPVMEGKAVLFKEYADIDAFPICLKTQDAAEIISIIRNIAPVFGGINLEDISAPRCFEIEEALQDLGIPVFHDDQHGTAIVVLAALINAAKVAGKNIESLNVVVNGAGSAGVAITKMLLGFGFEKSFVANVILCDRNGILTAEELMANRSRQELAKHINKEQISGDLAVAVKGADVLIGVSAAEAFSPEIIARMQQKSIVFAMANPVPEIMPDLARQAGAYLVGTGRSDFSNQINNVLVFPGIFRGALSRRAKVISNRMKIAAALALADYTKEPTQDCFIASVLDKEVAKYVAQKVAEAV